MKSITQKPRTPNKDMLIPGGCEKCGYMLAEFPDCIKCGHIPDHQIDWENKLINLIKPESQNGSVE